MNNKEAIVKYEAGELSIEQLDTILTKNLALSLEGTGLELHLAEGINPLYKDNNHSRNQIAYSWLMNKRGIFLQRIIKPTIIKAINFIHSAMKRKYDDQIFYYDDPRLIAINTFLTEYIETNFQDCRPYKTDFMHKLKDIAMGLCKEDKYYRARMFDILNILIKTYPDGFKLTDVEGENIKKYH